MIQNMDNNKASMEQPQHGLLGRLVDEKTGEPKDPSHCIIQYGGRVRLPDKLIEILNKDFAPEVIWWQPDGECFAFDSGKVQKKILDVWFRGTKLSSFIRSLNRWGFRRVFYHALPESALAFHHASFGKHSSADMLKLMKMSKSGGSKAAQAKANALAVHAQASAKPDTPPVPSNPVAATTSLMGHPFSIINTTNSAFVPIHTPDRLSQLSELAMAGISSSVGASMNIPQAPLSTLPVASSNNHATDGLRRLSGSALSHSANQDFLLKVLSEERNSQLLADRHAEEQRASAPSFASYPSPAQNQQFDSFSLVQRLLGQQQQQQQQEQQDQSSRSNEQQQQLMIQTLLAKQELVNRQQMEKNDAAIRRAILSMNARQQQGSAGGQGMP